MANPEIVRVYTVDENSDPLVGVLVRFYDALDIFVTQDVSSLVGADVYAEVTIDGDTPAIPYTIRMSKLQVAFDGLLGDDSKSPQAITVYSPPGASPPTSNGFTVQGQTFGRPAAVDPRLCRCSGFFRDPHGQPLSGYELHVKHTCFNVDQYPATPLIVDGDVVLGHQVIHRTDENGYMEFDLFRTGEYSVLLPGMETELRKLLVPDASSENIIELLFPVVTSVLFTPDPLALTSGNYVDVTVDVLASNGQVLDIADGDLTFTSSDDTVASIQVFESVLRVMGVAAGTCEITVVRSDLSIVTIPSEPATYAPLQVTVT